MAGKNTAVFGIYKDRASTERGVDGLKAGGFSNADISALFPEKRAPRISPPKSTPRHPKAPPQVRVPEHSWVEVWDGSLELERWRSQD